MKKKRSIKHLTAIVFLVVVMVNFLLGLYPLALGTFRMVRGLYRGEDVDVSTIEYTFNDRLPAKGTLITLNGGLQRLLGTRHLNERWLLNNGHMTYTMSRYDVADIADNTVAFAKALEQQGIPMVYVNAPFKINGKDKQLPVGASDYSNENADDFVAALREQNVSVLDLRESIEAEGLDHYSLFYKTDHHWTAETGFWAFTRIVEYLEGLDASFAVDSTLTDLNNYDVTVHEGIFLGSAGRRVGPLFSGMDDLAVIEPKFATSLRFRSETEGVDRTGTYQQTVLFPENLTGGDFFEVVRYNVYCNQDYDRLELTNYSARDSLAVRSTHKRLLVFKDSFSSVVIPFLALGYDQVCFIDLRLYQEDVGALIEEFRPDMVLVSYNVGAFAGSNSIMFDFPQ